MKIDKYKSLFYYLVIIVFIIIFSSELYSKPKLCLTFDDPNTNLTPILTWQERNKALLNTLKKYDLKAALFVCGKRIDSDSGSVLLKTWDDEGHLICNHSYSHLYLNSPKAVKEIYLDDILRCDSIIQKYSNYTRFFRFPYLKEGSTLEIRNFIRDELKKLNYKNGFVSIDASDWYVDGEMIKALKDDSTADLKPYLGYYLKHIKDRADYYNNLSVELSGREVSHALLLHHSLLNALFLDSLITMFKQAGWEIVNASEAYKDEIYTKQPDIIPAGESIIWGLAKESEKFEATLRYPAEDGEYEKNNLIEFMKK